MKTAGKPRGRVPKDNPCMATVGASVTYRERHKVHTEAAEAGLSVSKYLRRKLGLDEEVTGGAKNARLHQ